MFRFRAARLHEELFMVRPLIEGDAEAVATMHITELRTHFCGSTGRKLLSCYYRALAQGRGAFGYVWANESEPISGFICGIWDAKCLRRTLLCGEWLGLILWGTAHLVIHPRTLPKVIGRFAHSAAPFRKNAVSEGNGEEYELRPIAVRADSRGRGVADALLQRLLDDARSRGFASVNLQTEVDNDRANAFYRKSKFSLESTTDGYNYYRIRLGEPVGPSLSSPDLQATCPKARAGGHQSAGWRAGDGREHGKSQ